MLFFSPPVLDFPLVYHPMLTFSSTKSIVTDNSLKRSDRKKGFPFFRILIRFYDFKTFLTTYTRFLKQHTHTHTHTHTHSHTHIYIYIYIYIYINCHPQTDCFVVSQLFSVARHARRSKPGSKLQAMKANQTVLDKGN